MIKWNKTAELKPKEKQMCWITNIENDYIAGPFSWMGEGWIDLFATPEAGTMYTEKHITHWADEDEINMPSGT